MARPLDTTELTDLVRALTQREALVELAVLVACRGLAWLLVWALRSRLPEQRSIAFGKRAVDGVLFPFVALALAYSARALLAGVLPAAVFKLAIPVLLSLAVIRLCVRVLSVTFSNSRAMRVVERSISWLAWGAVILWITGVLPVVLDALRDISWKMGAGRMTLLDVVEGAITATLVMVAALWVSAAIEKRLLHGTSGDILSMRKMAANVVQALLLFVGVLVALSAAGIDLTALSVLGGAFGVGLGLGLQKVAANYVSGFVILAERSMRIGDMVKVDNFEGRITDIRGRYTVIRALNGRESIVPNETLITTRVENSSLADARVIVATAVQVAYGTAVRALRPKVEAAVSKVPRVLDSPAPACQLSNFAADGLELTINFWIADPENGTGNVRSDVNLAMLELLEAEGVEIPFPQRVLRRAR